MDTYRIDFAFDDQSGIYRCLAKNKAQAIDHFSLMVEQLAIQIDILRVVKEEKWTSETSIHEAQAESA